MALFSDAGIQFLFRWIHFLSGITWIGLLYYFNFVQGPFMAEADAATKSGATQKLVPRALWWFRWSAAVTFLAGVVILGLRRASWSDPWGLTILTGAAFGTVMLANVWRVIWPNQKIVIANAVAIAGGGQANPAAAGAARRAFLASRTNVVLSFPMLFLMGAASHFTLPASGNRGLWAVILLVGAVAPDFALPSTAGTDVPLSAFRGRKHVLLAFFPLAFTSTCTAENCAFSEDYDAFERAGTIVLPISVDSVPTLKEYKAKHAMRHDLLSDFKREVSRTYGVLLEDRFFSKRAYFLIDQQGILRWRHIEAELGARRDDAELLRQIATL